MPSVRTESMTVMKAFNVSGFHPNLADTFLSSNSHRRESLYSSLISPPLTVEHGVANRVSLHAVYRMLGKEGLDSFIAAQMGDHALSHARVHVVREVREPTDHVEIPPG